MHILGEYSARELLAKFGSPLYVYNEKILRNNCKNIQKLIPNKNSNTLVIYYAIKANTNIALLKIVQSEGLGAEVISPFEVTQAELAGFEKQDIFYSSNNISKEDMQRVIKQGIFVCIDSLCQLERYWQLGGKQSLCLRINPSIGVGHHDRVVTAGKVKFGVELLQVAEAFDLAKKYSRKINGLNIHIGSLFLDPGLFHQAVEELLQLAENYPSVDYIDFGGGFGIAYQEDEQDFPIRNYAREFQDTLTNWSTKNGRKVTFGIQPGRYIVANAGVCLTQVQSIKNNQGIDFIGVDLGFNFLLRPEFYGAYHKIQHTSKEGKEKKWTIVGNICEAGDVLGKDRLLPKDTAIDDILLIRDTGAYGFSMASNYNSMPRPAEVLITSVGKAELIRERESFSDIIRSQRF